MVGKKYIAVIGRITDLRSCSDDILSMIFEGINEKYASALRKPFEMTSSDTFHALLQDGMYLMDMLKQIRFMLYPNIVLYGIGVGQIHLEYDLSSQYKRENAFYNAQSAIKLLNKLQEDSADSVQTRIVLGYEDMILEEALNALFDMEQNLIAQMTEKQYEMIHETYFDHLTQKQLAMRHQVSQPNVHQILKKGGYRAYRNQMCTYQRIFEMLTK